MSDGHAGDGKAGKDMAHKWLLLPAPDGTCPDCARAHELDVAHDAQSLFYQYSFFAKQERWPTWADAVAHLAPDVQEQWKSALVERGAWTEPDPV